MKRITLPMTKEQRESLRAGDSVLLSGTIYTARDCAHKRIFALLDEGKELPFRPLPRARRKGVRQLRADDFRPHEQLCAAAFRSRASRHDRQRRDERGRARGIEAQ